MSQANTFLGRQPIVDRDEQTVAYELLFRGSADATSAHFSNYERAATRVVVNTFVSMGVRAVLGPYRGFINCSPGILSSDLLEALPAERMVLEVLETVTASAGVLERCQQLKAHGFQIALDDWVADDPREALLPVADVVKVDLVQVPKARLRSLVRELRAHPVCLLAEKVESADEFRHCKRLGFDLFQGYYFARPTVIAGRGIDPDRLVLVEILQQLGGQAETAEIAEGLKLYPDVALNLLRLANSVGLAPSQKIARLDDALMYLGRSQVRRWVALLLFAGEASSRASRNPLLLTAAHRGRLLELLAQRLSGAEADLPDRAFLVGLLSLIDVLLGVPQEEVIEDLGLDPVSRAAITAREGLLGSLLAAAECLEAGRFQALRQRLDTLGIDPEHFQQDENAAYQWVHELVAQLESSGG